MKRWPIIVGLVTYFLFCLAAWEIYREPVDRKLEVMAVQLLAKAAEAEPSVRGAAVSYDGMRGTLMGIEDADVAERVRGEIETSVGWGSLVAETGTREVVPEVPVSNGNDQIPPAEAPPVATFDLRPGAKAGTWLMAGELPDDDIIDTLVLGTREDLPSVKWIEAEHLRRAEVEMSGWIEALPAFVSLLISKADRASLKIDADGIFTVGGDVINSDDERQLLEEVEKVSVGGVIDQLRVPGTLEVTRTGGGKLEINAHVSTGQEVDFIAGELERLFAISDDGRELTSKISPNEVYCPGWMLKLLPPMAELIGEREGGFVRIAGGKLVIGGIAEGDGERDALLELARRAAGKHLEIEDAIEIRQISQLVVVKVGEDIILEGLLSDEDSAGKVLAEIQGKFPLAPAINREGLRVAEGIAAPKWFSRSVAILPQILGEIDAGRIEITDGGVVVFVGVRSPSAREAVIDLAGEIAGGEIPLGDVDAIILEAPQLGAFLEGEKVILTGRLPNEDLRASIVNSVRGYLSTVEIENQIEVDENVWDPEWSSAAGEVVPEFLQIASGLGVARMEIKGEKLTASARLPSDEMKEPIEILFSAFRRVGVKVDLKLEVLAQPRLLISHVGGRTKLGGRLRDIETKTKFARVLSAVFPDAVIEDSVVIDLEAAESGWDAMVMDLVSVVLSELKEPGIDLRPGKVRIEGEIPSEKAQVALEKRLVEEFGAAFEIESAIRIPKEKMVAEPRFELAEREGRWAIVGMVATAEEKAVIVDAIEAVRAKDGVIDELEVTNDVGASPWVSEIRPLVAALSGAKDPWLSVFRGTVIVEGEFADESARGRLSAAGGKLKWLKFEDSSTVKNSAPDVVVPPPPNAEVEPETEGS